MELKSNKKWWSQKKCIITNYYIKKKFCVNIGKTKDIQLDRNVCMKLYFICTSGEGRLSHWWLLRGLVSNLSPRIERSCWAMTACCSTEQWFSRDRIRGYGEACTVHRTVIQETLHIGRTKDKLQGYLYTLCNYTIWNIYLK